MMLLGQISRRRISEGCPTGVRTASGFGLMRTSSRPPSHHMTVARFSSSIFRHPKKVLEYFSSPQQSSSTAAAALLRDEGGKETLDFRQSNHGSMHLTERRAWSSAHIGLGSNLGDRFGNLHRAIRLVGELPLTQVDKTSFLYETESFYDPTQPRFLNGVLKIRTGLTPKALLAELQTIEKRMGRTKKDGEYRYAARPIDLDILLFNSMQMQTEELTIPHPLLSERGFVLRPLCDVDPSIHHPTFGRTMQELLDDILHPRNHEQKKPIASVRTATEDPIDLQLKAIQDRHCLSLDDAAKNLWYWGEQTYVMGVVNVTPDSFSDGGQFLDPNAAIQHILSLFRAGAAVVDIGGQSTRPGAPQITAQEELQRVLPVVQGVCERLADPETYRSVKGGPTIVLSIDTYRAEVAAAFIQVIREHNAKILQTTPSPENPEILQSLPLIGGMVNDISGGQLDRDMLGRVAELGVPYILTHMRGGNPETMQSGAEEVAAGGGSGSHLDYTPSGGVVTGVGGELWKAVQRAQAEGISAWNLILDPGIGFGKTAEDCYELVREMRASCPGHFPILSGPSRKSFLLSALSTGAEHSGGGEEVSNVEKDWGTAAALTASIASGASIVRVHNVEGARAVCRVADHIYRRHRQRNGSKLTMNE